MTTAELSRLMKILYDAEAIGLKLEIVRGLPIWEAHPAIRHQKAIDQIRATIKSTRKPHHCGGCGCVHFSDIYVLFSDGSLKRPDISIFCREPKEQESATRQIPAAVIVFNPYTLAIIHARPTTTTRHTSPVTFALECGCQCTV